MTTLNKLRRVNNNLVCGNGALETVVCVEDNSPGGVSRILFLELTELGERRHGFRRRPSHALDHCAHVKLQ